VEWLRSRSLTRLALQAWTDNAADAIAAARHLASLQSLEVNILPDSSDDLAGAARRMATLARSTNLTGLRELKMSGTMNPEGFEAILRDPAWTSLRKLDLQMDLPTGEYGTLAGSDNLPELEELRLSRVFFNVAQIAAFRHSPLLKRLRHFSVRGFHSVGFEIADAVDPNRIETFAIESNLISPRVARLLRDRFGDRLKLLD
jgi:hypothetical protein